MTGRGLRLVAIWVRSEYLGDKSRKVRWGRRSKRKLIVYVKQSFVGVRELGKSEMRRI